jgi:hypothetical protein
VIEHFLWRRKARLFQRFRNQRAFSIRHLFDVTVESDSFGVDFAIDSDSLQIRIVNCLRSYAVFRTTFSCGCRLKGAIISASDLSLRIRHFNQ